MQPRDNQGEGTMSRLLLGGAHRRAGLRSGVGKGQGRLHSKNALSCGRNLDAYTRTTFGSIGRRSGPTEVWDAGGLVSVNLTAFNTWIENGKQDILGAMSFNDTLRWLAFLVPRQPLEISG
jgi:hypothetical protein